ncbi:hypothetical protein PAHAL_1G314600 [Panicum hallii]|uniref:Uncharacterized protein n=1 Tax=Panicum hallii TaxID=206008 RepID=A0A2S3GR72_9POAL|nr:hypothetical protein PAHAL_1G314600 [Panicum hallii]
MCSYALCATGFAGINRLWIAAHDTEKGEDQALVSGLLDWMMKCENYGEPLGAAFGLAGVVKGFGISSLKK